MSRDEKIADDLADAVRDLDNAKQVLDDLRREIENRLTQIVDDLSASKIRVDRLSDRAYVACERDGDLCSLLLRLLTAEHEDELDADLWAEVSDEARDLGIGGAS